MPGILIFKKHITRAEIIKGIEFHKIYLFGDNMLRQGYGGQAQEMRALPNSFGVPTKWSPYTGHTAYFCDNDLKKDEVFHAIDYPFLLAAGWLRGGYIVVMPKDGIGTGLAKLSEKAPNILRRIESNTNWLASMAAEVRDEE